MRSRVSIWILNPHTHTHLLLVWLPYILTRSYTYTVASIAEMRSRNPRKFLFLGGRDVGTWILDSTILGVL